MNELMLHNGSSRLTREELKKISTPPATKSWRPVAHFEIADMLAGEAKRRSYQIASEEYGINSSGTKMFGVLRFHPYNHPEFSRALGVRNSHDKSFALGLSVGLSVLVCDNLCFGGECSFYRRHTSGITAGELIYWTFHTLEHRFHSLLQKTEEMKIKEVSDDEARIITVQAAESGAIPSGDILTVLDEYRNPKHDEFQARTSWSLYNAFTETAKKYSFARADKSYRKLAELFALK